jgi:hypothetical protein
VGAALVELLGKGDGKMRVDTTLGERVVHTCVCAYVRVCDCVLARVRVYVSVCQ